MKNCGLRRAFALGGVPDSGNSDMLKKLALSQQSMSALDMQGQREEIENAANQQKFTGLQGQMDNITGLGGSGLSQRQKAAALGQLQGEAGKMGMSLDTGVSNMTGLSSRQRLGADMASLSAQGAITDFNKNRELQRTQANYADQNKLALPLPGFKQGGTVGVDKDGFIDGPGGVDNVPARVAETGEEIRVGAGERIVNKQQNAALEKLAEAAGMDLDDYLESATGKPVGPTMKKGLRAAADGWPLPTTPQEAWQEHQSRQAAAAAQKQAAAQAIERAGANAAAAVGDVANTEAAAATLRPQATPAATPTTAPATQPAIPRSEQFGRNLASVYKGSVPTLRSAAGGAAAVAGTGLAAYDAHQTSAGHDDFYKDPEVGFADKAMQAGRDIYRAGMPLVGATVGSGLPMPVLGTLGGAALGTGLRGIVDAEGDALKKYRKANPVADTKPAQFESTATSDPKQIEAIKAANANIMAGGEGNGQAAPIGIDKRLLPDAPKPGGKLAEKAVSAEDKAKLTFEREADVRGLRAAGVTGGNIGDKTENGKTPATGIRVIEGANGQKIYAGRDKNGQLIVNSGSGKSEAETDKARDAEFAKLGYGKDAYGNWMTPQRLGDKQALEQIQRERANFDAFDSSITDPNARASGLRRVAMYEMRDQKAAEAAAKQLDAKLKIADYNLRAQGQKNMQANSDREFNDKRAGNRDKVLNDWLDNYSRVPTKDGKSEIDYGIRNELQAAMLNVGNGEIPSDPNELSKHLTTYGNQARLTARMNAAVRQHGGVTDPRNWGVRGKTSTQATVPTLAGTDMFGNELVRVGDMKVPLRDIVGDDADLLAEYKRRINSVK